jgi:hypothetical protein
MQASPVKCAEYEDVIYITLVMQLVVVVVKALKSGSNIPIST